MSLVRGALPRRSLVQIRLILMVIAIFDTLLAGAQAVAAVHFSAPRAAGMLVALVLLIGAWVSAYWRGGYTLREDAVATMAVAALVVSVGWAAQPIAVLYMCGVLRTLYAGGGRRLAAAIAAALAAYGAGLLVTGQTTLLASSVPEFLAIILIAAMMSLVRRSLAASDASIDREELFARTGAALLQATTTEEVFELLRGAVSEGSRALVGARVTVSLDSAVTSVSPVLRAGRTVLTIPVARGTRMGDVAVSSPTGIPVAIEQMATALAAQAALAVGRIVTSDRWSSLVENSSDLTIVVDGDGVMRWLSPAAQSVLGHHVEDLVDLPLAGMLEPSEVSTVTDHG